MYLTRLSASTWLALGPWPIHVCSALYRTRHDASESHQVVVRIPWYWCLVLTKAGDSPSLTRTP